MKRPSARSWLFGLFGLVIVVAIAIPLVTVLAQSTAPLTGPSELCPQCPVSFRTPSILAPSSTETRATLGLFNFISIIAGVIFVLVEGLLLFAVFRFRNRRPEQALQIHGNTKLEIAWTAMPAIILAVLLGFTFQTMGEISALPTGNVIQVKAIGHQWWWEFRYTDLKPELVTANELVVPMGAAVEVAVESVDVEHGFWTPELFGKVDAVPGYVTRVKFTPTHTGTFGGQCTQYCGTQHAQMRFSVRVLYPAEFQAWLANEQLPAAAAATGDAKAGEDYLLNNPNAQCKACHILNGTSANIGVVGPNLTHLASRSFIAGGILANTPENLKIWLSDPQAAKPGNLMKIVPLDEKTINDLVAYLTTLK